MWSFYLESPCCVLHEIWSLATLKNPFMKKKSRYIAELKRTVVRMLLRHHSKPSAFPERPVWLEKEKKNCLQR